MLQYREIFYKKYYSSQLGRGETDYHKKLNEEILQLTQEILPWAGTERKSKVLDIGCGIGSLVKTFKHAGYTDVTGIDLSGEMVEVAHSLGISEVQQGDLNDFLVNNKNSFDLITGIDIIEHFTKDELVSLLILVKEALKPNGIAIFRTPNADALHASVFAYGDFTHENYLNSSSAKQVMLNCGFNEVKILPGLIFIQNPFKELVRKILWFFIKFRIKLELFATGRSSRNIILNPNLLIRVKK